MIRCLLVCRCGSWSRCVLGGTVSPKEPENIEGKLLGQQAVTADAERWVCFGLMHCTVEPAKRYNSEKKGVHFRLGEVWMWELLFGLQPSELSCKTPTCQRDCCVIVACPPPVSGAGCLQDWDLNHQCSEKLLQIRAFMTCVG